MKQGKQKIAAKLGLIQPAAGNTFLFPKENTGQTINIFCKQLQQQNLRKKEASS